MFIYNTSQQSLDSFVLNGIIQKLYIPFRQMPFLNELINQYGSLVQNPSKSKGTMYEHVLISPPCFPEVMVFIVPH